MNNLPDGHPAKVYLEENMLIRGLMASINSIDKESNFEEFSEKFQLLCRVEKHFARKENQLFPYLEKYNWNGPSQGMWSFHDTLRDQIRLLNKYNEERNIAKITEQVPYLIEGIKRLLSIEDMRLFPNAMELLNDDDWKEFHEGDEEIGWMLVSKPKAYGKPEAEAEAYVHPSQDFKKRELSFSLENTFHYDEGYMTPEQVNLLLRFMPVDITYVDENDKVIFYNRGKDRVFPRSKGIIGREVRFCHPPKSVDMVLRIVEEFKAGTKDVAEFWINFKGRMIHIRYFAIRDNENKYRGVIEMSQDVTDIRELEGQQRLLDWD